MSLRTTGSGASGLTSETPCQVPAAAGVDRRRPAPGSAAPVLRLYWEAGPVRRFRMRHQEAPVGTLTIGQLLVRHAGIPRGGLHSNRPKFTLVVSSPERHLWFPCFTAGAPRSAVTSLPTPPLERGEPAISPPAQFRRVIQPAVV